MSSNRICLQKFITPLGELYAASTDKGICLLGFVDRYKLKFEMDKIQLHLNANFVSQSNLHLDKAKLELKEYFNKKRKIFSVSLHVFGTEFQKKVWNTTLSSIHYGETWSYQKLDNYINKKKSVRATASALSRNHISIIIPCHRVIGKDGSLTGYAGGLHRKKWLLEHEN